MGNRPFDEKRDGRRDGESDRTKICYRNSLLHVQRDLTEGKEWNKESIRKRGNTIIDFALDRWRINPTACGNAGPGSWPNREIETMMSTVNDIMESVEGIITNS